MKKIKNTLTDNLLMFAFYLLNQILVMPFLSEEKNKNIKTMSIFGSHNTNFHNCRSGSQGSELGPSTC